MFAIVWMLGIRLRSFLRRYAPSNVLLAVIFTRRGLTWGMLSVLVAGLYLLAAVLCVGLLEGGGPGWVNMLVLLFLWNAIKFAIAGPVSLLWLVRLRIAEQRARRLARPPELSGNVARVRSARATARVLH